MNTIKLAQNTQEITPDFRFQDRRNTKTLRATPKEPPGGSQLSRPPPRSEDRAAAEKLSRDDCAVCNRGLPRQTALDDLEVCTDCLRIYGAVDRVLNLRAFAQTENRKRKLMLEKWRENF